MTCCPFFELMFWLHLGLAERTCSTTEAGQVTQTISTCIHYKRRSSHLTGNIWNSLSFPIVIHGLKNSLHAYISFLSCCALARREKEKSSS